VTFSRQAISPARRHCLNNTVGRYLSGWSSRTTSNISSSSVGGNEEQIIFHINQIFDSIKSRHAPFFRH